MGFRFLLLSLFISATCSAQIGISGSILGYVFDPANGVQPILGIPGAATIGPPLELGAEVTGIATASQRGYVLAKTATDSNFTKINLDAPATLGPLGASISSGGLTVLSATGSAAASYDRDRKYVVVFTGLPDAASFAREFDLSAFSEIPASIAVDDSGEIVLIGFAQSVVAFGADGSTATLSGPHSGTAMRFLNRSRDAVIVDGTTNTFYLVRDLPTASETRILRDSIPEPIAVAVSNDNKRVFVASSLRGEVTGIELSSGAAAITTCFCKPSTLVSLNGNAIFRLTEPSGSPLWVYDGDGAEPRIVFVPPYRRDSGEAFP